uniref:Titin n=1 Tax=Ciona savignyi TaxID=51511 RepID=H2YFD6_CIOSA
TNYIIEKKETSSDTWSSVNANCSRTTVKAIKLNQNSEYVFRIAAENKYGLGEFTESQEVVAKHPFRTPTVPPQPEVVEISADVMTVVWKECHSDGGSQITGYHIEKKERNAILWTKANLATLRSREFKATGLTEGLEYQFRVYAENMAGKSAPSEASKPERAHNVVSPPTCPDWTDITRDSVTLVWKPPKSDGGSKIIGYNLEKRSGADGRWLKCNYTNVQDCEFTATALNSGEKYQFRVTARNASGTVSKPSIPSAEVVCHDDFQPPMIQLDTDILDGVNIRAGVTLRLKANISGKPEPNVFWSKGETDLEDGEKTTILSAGKSTALIIKDISREDSAKYTLLLRNECGEKRTSINVKVLDKPGRPKGPITFSRVTAEKCNLSWERPEEDGGANVTHYVVEKRETSRVSWIAVHEMLEQTSCTVPNLIVNNEYIFRISAVNKYGQGQALESEPLVAKNQFVTPDSPGQPEIASVTRDSITVTWTRPINDGGSDIKSYIIEKRDKQGYIWIRCNKNQDVTDLRYKACGLRNKALVEFRVAAENAAGVGKFSEASAFGCVQDPVFPPAAPVHLKVTDSTRSSVSLSWAAPLFDGGSPVDGYIIEFSECKADSEDRWQKTHKSNYIQSTEFIATGLKHGLEYKFRVFAVNINGTSEEPATLSETVFAKEILEEPELELDDTFRKTVNVHAGKPLRLCVFVKGRPAPSVTWTKAPNGEELTSRAFIETHEAANSLEIEKVDRHDAGKYTVSIENASGRKETTINVRVYDTPGAPGPIVIREITRNSISFSWESPEVDGGSVVRSYVVEKREATRRAWSTVTTKCSKLSYKIADLMEGVLYFFRVLGVNEYGVGEGRETEAAIKISEHPSVPASVEVYDVTSSSVSLAWDKPEHDGGSRIDGYVIEMMEKGTDKWIKVGKSKEQQHMVKGLKDGLDYYFRIRATNESGLGDARELLSSVTVKEQLASPVLDMSSLPQKTLNVKAGEPIQLNLPISGRPAPTVVWTRNEKPIKEDLHRTTIKSTATQASLEIRESTVDDRGDYRITLHTSGTCTQLIRVIILDVPQPPEGPVEISDVTSTSIMLSWKLPNYDGGAAISNYVVEKRESHRPNWVCVSSTVTRTNMKVTHLKEDSEYVFRILAQNRLGVSKPLMSDEVVVQSQHALPGAPGTPQVSSVSKDSMTIVWMEPVNDGGTEVTGYIVERKEPKSSRWIRASRAPITQTRFISSGLIEGVEYIHRVIAVNAKGEGKPSKETSPSKCQEPVAPPSAPRNPRIVDMTKATLSVAWDKPEYEGGSKLMGYYIEIRQDGAWWERYNATPIRITEYTLKGMPEGGEFYLRVLAINSGGAGRPVEIEKTIVVRDQSGPPEVLQSFTEPIVVRKGGVICLKVPFKCRPSPQASWKKISGPEVDLNVRAMIALHTDSAELVIKGVDRRDAGEYEVTLSNKLGKISVSIRVQVIGKPDAPEGPLQFGDIQATSVNVVWKPITNDGGSEVTNYVVEKREVGKTAWMTVDSKIRSTQCTVKGLTEGKEYFFRVFAENAFGLGDALKCIESVTAKNPLFPPQPPQLVEINEVRKDKVFLAWTRSRDDGGSRVTGYFVERKEAGSERWVRVNKILTKNLSFMIQGLVEDAEYQFRVVALNDVGEGEPTESTEIIQCKDPFDKPTCPEEIEVHHVTKDSITLAWNKPEFNGGKGIQGYAIEHREFGMTMWKQSHEDMIRDRIYQIGGLDQGAEYEFRIFAINDQGRSRPKMMETPVSTKKAAGEKPVIVETLQTVMGVRESTATLTCTVSGRPMPDITWVRFGKELLSGRKYKMISEGQVNKLNIINCCDEDEGYYSMVAKNNVGSADTEGKLVVEGTPILDNRNLRFKDHVVAKGQTVRIHVPYTGRPQVQALWTKEGRRFDKSERHEIETTDNYTHFVIKTCDRTKDVGKYLVKLTNAHGHNVYSITVDIQDVPNAPTDVEVTDISFNSMVLKWKSPQDDGGAPVSNFIVEKRDIEDEEDKWTLVTSRVAQTSYKVERLIEKHAYYFRISAENLLFSKPFETDKPVAAKPPHDVPQKPTQLLVSGVSKTGCMLTWKQPKDGGCRITNYIVQRRDTKRPRWQRISDDTLTQSVFNVNKLVEGISYEFRIIAENAVGPSDPSDVSEQVVPKNDIRISAPKFAESIRDMVVKPNANVTFSCKVIGQPKPIIKWYKGGREITGCSQYKISEAKGNHYTLVVHNVTVDHEGPYTVRATNQAGSISQTVEMTVQLPAKINLPKYMMTEAIVCRVHEVVSIKVPIEGKPQPDITWSKAGKLVSADGHRQFITASSFTSMTITNADRRDSGFYNVIVKNRFGTNQATIELLVGDVPAKPESLKVSNVTRDSVDLTWKEPSDNGGKPVLKYVLEKCTTSSDCWVKVSSSGTCKYTVCNLSGKTGYLFRVRAENEYGQSKPSSPSDAVTTKEDRMMAANYDDMVDATEKFVASEARINKSNVMEKYQIMEQLGRGTFGTVHRAREILTGKTYAVKLCRFTDETEKVPINREVSIMRKLQHPRVLQLHEVFDTKLETALVVQFVSGGDLLERIIATKFELTENACAYIIKQVLEALAYVHSQNVAHLDIKPENILFITRKSKKIKLIDFGVSRELKTGEGLRISFGTPDFCAPEVVQNDTVGCATDMWSVGVLTYLMLTGLSPFQGENDNDTLRNVSDADYNFEHEAWRFISDDALDFIDRLLLKDKRERMTADDALEHPWLRTSIVIQTTQHKFYQTIKMQDTSTVIISLGRYAGGALRSLKGKSVAKVKVQSVDMTPQLMPMYHVFVKEKDDAKISCRIRDADDNETIAWYKDNLKLEEGDKYEFAYDAHTSSASLYVKVVRSDDGNYKCRVENAFGSSTQTCEVCVELKTRSIYLNRHKKRGRKTAASEFSRIVKCPPEFTLPLYNRTVYTGDTAIFTITVTVHPTPEISWYHKGQKIIINSEETHYAEIREKGLYTLEIRKSQLEDSGEVIVQAKNAYGEDECKAMLTVQDKPAKQDLSVRPMFRRLLANQDVDEGNNARFDIRVTGFPKPTIEWEKDGKPLRADHHHDVEWEDLHSCYLLIRDSFQEDAGEYKVIAKNSAGTASCQATLQVHAVTYQKRKKKDADLFAREKAYQLADKVSVFKGDTVDIHLNNSAQEALLTASTQGMFHSVSEHRHEEEERKEEIRRELNLRMPYTVPEPVQRSEKSLKEDKTLSKFVPLSDFKWYKKVRDSKEIYHPTDISREEKKSYRLKRQFVPDVAYIVPDKRIGSMRRERQRDIDDIMIDDHARHRDRSLSPEWKQYYKPMSDDEQVLQPVQSFLDKASANEYIQEIEQRGEDQPPPYNKLDSDDELLRPVSYDTWKYSGVKTEVDISTTKPPRRQHSSSSSASESEGDFDYKRKRRERERRRQEQIEEIEVEMKMIKSASQKRVEKKSKDEEPDYITKLRRRRSFEFEELMRPVTEVLTKKKKRRPVYSSSSSSDSSDEEYYRQSRRQRQSKKSRYVYLFRVNLKLKISVIRKYEEYEEDISSGVEFTSSKLKARSDKGVTLSAADYAPSFQLRMRSHVVPCGMSTKLSAFVRGRPEPQVTWYRNGTELASGGTKYYVSNIGGVTTLEIVRCHEGDSGTYRCSAKNYLGENSDYSTLEVTGSEFESTASKRGVQDFHMTMDMVDVRSTISRSRFDAISQATERDASRSSTAFDDQMSHASGFTPYVGSESRMGSMTPSSAAGAPYFVIQPKSQYVLEGDSAYFAAQCDGKPSPKLTWYHDGRIIKDNEKYSLGAIRGKRTLEIRDCQVIDVGNYVCIAESSKGSATTEFTLDVTPRR